MLIFEAWYIAQNIFLRYVKQQRGCLVNIISDFALMGFPGKTTYSSSKAAVMAFSNSLCTELHGTGTTVALVIPPAMATDIVLNGIHIDVEKQQNEQRFLQKHGMPVEKAAQRIVREIQQRKSRIVVGSMMHAVDVISRLFPTLLHKAIGKSKNRFDFI